MSANDTAQNPDRPERLAECLQKLTAINRALSSRQLDVEEAVVRLKEGVRLHARASEILAQARLRVRELVPDPGAAAEGPECSMPACGSEDDLPF
jgi:exodeoxyribonuclease VII small subunit